MLSLWEVLLQCILLIIVLILLRPLFKRSLNARLRYALWLIPLARLLIPIAVESSFSIWGFLQIQRDNLGIDKLESWSSIGVTNSLYVTAIEPSNQATQAVLLQPSSSYLPVTFFSSILGIVWALGTLAFLTILCSNNVRFKKRIKDSKLINSCVLLPVLVSDEVKAPCLVGVLRPRILIPSRIKADEFILDMMLRHELSHYRHGDHIWTLVRGILRCIWWWNPLIWLASYLSQEDGEAACDESVICKMEVNERKKYGMSLLSLLTSADSTQPMFSTINSMYGTKRILKERIIMIANWKKMSGITVLCTILCVMLLMLSLGTIASAQTSLSPKNQTFVPLVSDDAKVTDSDKTYFMQVYTLEYEGCFARWDLSDKIALISAMKDAGIADPDDVASLEGDIHTLEEKIALANKVISDRYGNTYFDAYVIVMAEWPEYRRGDNYKAWSDEINAKWSDMFPLPQSKTDVLTQPQILKAMQDAMIAVDGITPETIRKSQFTMEYADQEEIWVVTATVPAELLKTDLDVVGYDAPDGSFGITGNTVTKLFDKYGALVLESFSLDEYRNSIDVT